MFIGLKWIDLEALSMTGSLVPAVPFQLMVKYNPPKITLVYYFEKKENEKYFHDIEIEKRMLVTASDEEIVSHLYMSEAFYFDPKKIKRPQVLEFQLTLIGS